MIYAATTERSIAMVLLAVVVVGWAIYVFVNIRRSKSEVGSEIELAANRGSLPDDEVLEGSRLEQVQAFGVLMLLIIALVLPIYWLREGGRRAGAEQGFGERAAAAGERLAEELECVVCHGADLGGANYAPVVLDIGNQFSDEDTYIVKTTWRAPALNTVFARFDTDAENLDEVDEVRQILNYGRGVMPAWGLPGGGPLTPQEVDNLIAWLWRERMSDDDASQQALRAKETEMAAHPGKSEGQVLFELHCARCHTPRWPARGPAQLPNNGGEVEVIPGPPGSGRYGPALNAVSLERLFPDIEDQMSFITSGAADNVAYGEFARLGNYGMPGFGRILTQEEIRAISEYERSLDLAEQSTVQFAELHTSKDDQ
ncbi:MAG: cytochrome c [Acidimicrobiales bacterium]|nr:cytochrome c [Acidimicrobiales bacterium]